MKIIFGLGNPTAEYIETRHNVGFLFVDKIREKYSLPEFEFNKNFQAEISKGKINDAEIILVKPQTFMNLSGTSAQSILNFYKLTPADIFVIHDDLDIGLEKYKLATDSSPAGHNGVKDIIERLGTQKFIRARIGIGQQLGEALVCRLDAHDFVLGKLSIEEINSLEKISENIFNEVEKFVIA